MSAQLHTFEADLELACRIWYGPGSMIELAGTALRIDPQVVVVSIPPGAPVPYPRMGDKVHLEVQLPLLEHVQAKCLRVEARVSKVRELKVGARHLTLTFRKATFRELMARNGQPAANGRSWRM